MSPFDRVLGTEKERSEDEYALTGDWTRVRKGVST